MRSGHVDEHAQAIGIPWNGPPEREPGYAMLLMSRCLVVTAGQVGFGNGQKPRSRGRPPGGTLKRTICEQRQARHNMTS